MCIRDRCNVLCDAVGLGQIVGLVVGDGREIGRDVLANFFEVRLFKRLDARGDALVGEDKNGRAVFARNVDGLDRGVKTIFHARRREHDSRRIAVTAEAGDVQVGLLDEMCIRDRALAFAVGGLRRRVDDGDVAGIAVGNFSCCGHKNLVSHRQRFFGGFADHLFEKFNRLVERIKAVIVA